MAVERFDVFSHIAERAGGSIYVGVVGPVRTGKSTFVRRFTELLVLPRMEDPQQREQARDQLPQSGSGRTIMTTQPRFVPDEPVEIPLGEAARVRVRAVDCVGYTVPGALGYEEEGRPRMVRTPWFEEEIPFQQAAEVGTRKVIEEHSTIGLLVTTDGSIAELPREAYVAAEERVVRELKALGKPFMVLLNSTHPSEPATQQLAQELTGRYGVPVHSVDVLHMEVEELSAVLRELLWEFPVREVAVQRPRWIDELPAGHWLTQRMDEAVRTALQEVQRVRDVESAARRMADGQLVEQARVAQLDLAAGSAFIALVPVPALFYRVLQELTGVAVEGDHQLLRVVKELVRAREAYEQVREALAQVRATGYGVVTPRQEDITFQDPEIIRQGSRFGVRLKASAPTIHLIRADVTTEVTPFVGTERQGEEFARYLAEQFEQSPERLWESEFLGRSLQELVREGIESKLHRLPEHAQQKLQETLSRIINEGSGGLICILL